MYRLQGNLTPVPPFDFNQSLTFVEQLRPAMGEQHVENGILTKAMSIEGQIIVFAVQSVGTVESPELTYRFYSDQPIEEAIHQLGRDRIQRFLSLDDDLRPFYQPGYSDPAFEPIIEELYGYHQVKFLTPFENAIWAVLSQRNLLPVTRKMKAALIEQYGGQLVVDGATYRAFPEAGQLALLHSDEINAVIHNRWKAQGVIHAARAFDGVDEDWLRSAPYDEAEKWLRSIKGIGAWSSSFILLRGLGRMERLPVDEKWLPQAAARWYGRDAVTQGDVEQLAKSYGEYAGYWAHYLRAAM